MLAHQQVSYYSSFVGRIFKNMMKKVASCGALKIAKVLAV